MNYFSVISTGNYRISHKELFFLSPFDDQCIDYTKSYGIVLFSNYNPESVISLRSDDYVNLIKILTNTKDNQDIHLSRFYESDNTDIHNTIITEFVKYFNKSDFSEYYNVTISSDDIDIYYVTKDCMMDNHEIYKHLYYTNLLTRRIIIRIIINHHVIDIHISFIKKTDVCTIHLPKKI